MSTADCPAYSKEFDKLENNLELQQYYDQFRSVFNYIINHTNLEMNNITTISSHTQLLYYSFLIEVNIIILTNLHIYRRYNLRNTVYYKYQLFKYGFTFT